FPSLPQRCLAFESGRFLVASAGSLVATVVDVKVSKGKQFAVLDSGINHLGGMPALGRLPRVQPLFSARWPQEETDSSCLVDVVGPLCTPLDWWVRGRPAQLAPGDRIVVPNVGAYGLTASLVAFLGRECATEIVIDGDGVVDATVLTLKRTSVPARGHSQQLAMRPA